MSQAKLSQVEVVQALRNEAEKNPVFNAVAHSFAVRERTRFDIRIDSLKARMEKEGFKFSREDYASIMKFLSDLGLGTLVLNRNRNIKGLTQINTTLQSVGKAALTAEQQSLRSKRQTHKFQPLAVDHPKADAALPKVPKPKGTRLSPVIQPKAAIDKSAGISQEYVEYLEAYNKLLETYLNKISNRQEQKSK